MKLNRLTTEQLRYLKRNYFTPAQKTYCKKFEQRGANSFKFKVNGKSYTLKYEATKVYSDFVFAQQSQNTGLYRMHKGNNVRKQDSYGKVNYAEQNLINKIDKKSAKK